ncbi:hypothetical protein M427DRAFT_41232 [Gonapodya prolifera JEL478]|uniref:E3 ubiquitin-protein ligase n=1 Tax=Gonapodya prolifera (strain JEL478) TaxID=1344416 RepID=A0A139AV38_GONPJ|nr:hypothetical protein M427DRAFT_41232 [Gonapodya prolifera JEL478]|eukprot:KXS20443.1 hypothetical protein M427DRAFT_41232 [Gonapodya prolifera JEL478]
MDAGSGLDAAPVSENNPSATPEEGFDDALWQFLTSFPQEIITAPRILRARTQPQENSATVLPLSPESRQRVFLRLDSALCGGCESDQDRTALLGEGDGSKTADSRKGKSPRESDGGSRGGSKKIRRNSPPPNMQSAVLPEPSSADAGNTEADNDDMWVDDDDDETESDSEQDQASDDEDIVGAEYSSAHRGKVCGHVFRKGEAIYRCRTCSLDETCVLCLACFRSTHPSFDPATASHEYNFSISRGGGGYCDCGDPEAWRVPLACQYHSPTAPGSGSSSDADPQNAQLPERGAIPPHILSAIRSTMSTTLDFILLSFLAAPAHPPAPPRSADAVAAALARARERPVWLAAGGSPRADEDGEQKEEVALVLWNDEEHSFDVVIDAIRRALGVDAARARDLTVEVDKVGRSILLHSSRPNVVYTSSRPLTRVRLTVTAHPLRLVILEEVGALCLTWLLRTVNRAAKGPWGAELRTALCEALLKHGRRTVVEGMPHEVQEWAGEVGWEGLDGTAQESQAAGSSASGPGSSGVPAEYSLQAVDTDIVPLEPPRAVPLVADPNEAAWAMDDVVEIEDDDNSEVSEDDNDNAVVEVDMDVDGEGEDMFSSDGENPAGMMQGLTQAMQELVANAIATNLLNRGALGGQVNNAADGGGLALGNAQQNNGGAQANTVVTVLPGTAAGNVTAEGPLTADENIMFRPDGARPQLRDPSEAAVDGTVGAATGNVGADAHPNPANGPTNPTADPALVAQLMEQIQQILAGQPSVIEVNERGEEVEVFTGGMGVAVGPNGQLEMQVLPAPQATAMLQQGVEDALLQTATAQEQAEVDEPNAAAAVATGGTGGFVPAIGQTLAERFLEQLEGRDGRVQPPAGWSGLAQAQSITPPPVPHNRPMVRPRLDYFFKVERNLPKSLRDLLRDLFIRTLMIDAWSKKDFGSRFASNYLPIAHSHLFLDREPEHSIFLFCVQLFTVPSVAEHLVSDTRALFTLTNVFKAFYLNDALRQELPLDPARVATSFQLALTHRAPWYPPLPTKSNVMKSKRTSHLFADLEYLLSVPPVRKTIFRQRVDEYFPWVLDALCVWQGMHPQARKLGSHVDYEDQTWVDSFRVAIYAGKLVWVIGAAVAPTGEYTVPSTLQNDYEQWKKAVNMTIVWLDKWSQTQVTMDPLAGVWDHIIPTYAQMEAFRMPNFTIGGALGQDNLKYTSSYHYPVHWLLAELLSASAYFFKDSMTSGVSQALAPPSWTELLRLPEVPSAETETPTWDERLHRIFDYTMRVLVLSGQVRAGLWVRNGWSLMEQDSNYRSRNLQELGRDQDVFILQTFAACLPASRFLGSLLHRYGLADWFAGNHKASIGVEMEPQHLSTMAEDMLELLIVIITERTKLGGQSWEEQTRKEIVHQLALHWKKGGAAHSEILRTMSSRNEVLVYSISASREDVMRNQERYFDLILAEVTNFKEPEGSREVGLYELKEAYWGDVDPWFYKYTRNQRQEVEEALKSRRSKETSDSDSTLARLPRLLDLPRGSLYTGICDLVQSELFTQILYFSVYNATTRILMSGVRSRVPSAEFILGAAGHLLLIAVAEESAKSVQSESVGARTSFFESALTLVFSVPEEEGGAKRTLLDLLLDVVDRGDPANSQSIDTTLKSEVQEILSTVKVALEEFGRLGSPSLKAKLEQWRKHKETRSQLEDTFATRHSEENEKKKAAAKARQAAIMAQLKQQQQNFSKKYADDLERVGNPNEDDDDDDDMDTYADSKADELSGKTWHFPRGDCIVCQEPANEESNIYGILGLIQVSSAVRTLTCEDKTTVATLLATPDSLDTPDPTRIRREYQSDLLPHAKRRARSRGMHISTCGHLMHFGCFESYIQSIEARHEREPQRFPPETLEKCEFLCPLCKGLGNVLLPILWTTKTEKVLNLTKLETGNTTNYAKEIVDLSAWGYQLVQRGIIDQITNNFSGSSRDITAALVSSVQSGQSSVPDASEGTSLAPPSGGILSTAARLPRLLGNAMSHLWRRNSLSSTSTDESSSNTEQMVNRVKEMYRSRVIRTFQIAMKDVVAPYDQDENYPDLQIMWEAFSYTLQTTELASRRVDPLGPEGPEMYLFVDGINNQTLLRVLSQTIMTYSTIATQESAAANDLKTSTQKFIVALFFGFEKRPEESAEQGTPRPSTSPSESSPTTLNAWARSEMDRGAVLSEFPPSSWSGSTPLLLEHAIGHLTRIAMTVTPSAGLSEISDVLNWIRLFHLLELVRIFIFVADALSKGDLTLASDATLSQALKSSEGFPGAATVEEESMEDILLAAAEPPAVREFMHCILEKLRATPSEASNVMKELDGEMVHKLVRILLIPYMRSASLLLYSRFDTVPPSIQSTGEPEYERLRKFLRLPQLSELISPSVFSTDPFLSPLIGGWIAHLNEFSTVLCAIRSQEPSSSPYFAYKAREPSFHVPVVNPLPLQLAPLPPRLDELVQEGMRRRCPNCNTSPVNPALCLLCGAIVCASSMCCVSEQQGECNMHMASCGINVGVYVLVKKGICLLLSGGKGTYHPLPYLDAHGESDVGLKRGRPLFLNTKRFEDIRKLFVSHGVASFIARKIEQSWDMGGWERF